MKKENMLRIGALCLLCAGIFLTLGDDAAQAIGNCGSAVFAGEKSNAISVPSREKPVVELFVMSQCPYAAEMERGLIPALKALGSKIDFQLKFCDYSMHGLPELNEELNQYCISQTQSDKLIPYLECYLAAGGSSSKCKAQSGIDTGKLATCVSSTDSAYKITANAADSSTFKSGIYPAFPIFQADVDKYRITGSPTLVINGTTIYPNRDPQSLLTAVCNGFLNAPAECSACGPNKNIKEGAMIRARGDIDIYIVKYMGCKRFKRLILSPSVFESYGHLKWGDVIEVDPSVVDSYATSEYVRVAGDDRIWQLKPSGDTGRKAEVFGAGYDTDSVYEINAVDRDSYAG